MQARRNLDPDEIESVESSEVAGVEPLHQQVCQRVRNLRKSRGWTLEQLSSLSGVSRSMLSQIERGAANPTLGVAYRIAQAFSLSLGDLVDVGPSGPRIEVVRSGDRSAIFRDDGSCLIRTLSPLRLEKDVEFYELTLKPGAALDSAPHYVGTREFVTVTKGDVRVTSGNESNDLGPGDSAHYAADVPHRIENTGKIDAVVFLVDIYEPTRGAPRAPAR
jgi:transcriptional regulator with XRE-family HTH domain